MRCFTDAELAAYLDSQRPIIEPPEPEPDLPYDQKLAYCEHAFKRVMKQAAFRSEAYMTAMNALQMLRKFKQKERSA